MQKFFLLLPIFMFSSCSVIDKEIQTENFTEQVSRYILPEQRDLGTQLWRFVGQAGFSDGQGDYPHVRVDKSNKAYVAYIAKDLGSKVVVKYFDGVSWKQIGDFVSDAASDAVDMEISPDGTPYVVYGDLGVGGKATMKRLTGSRWELFGDRGFTGGKAWSLSIAFDSGAIPHVAFQDGIRSKRASVAKYDIDNQRWVLLGDGGFTKGRAECLSMDIDDNNNIYLAYIDAGFGNKVHVKKFDGTSGWWTVNTALTRGKGGSVSLKLDSSGTPYVAFTDFSAGRKTFVKKLSSSGAFWEDVGGPGSVSASEGHYNTLKIDKYNDLYLAYQDYGVNKKLIVKKFDGSVWYEKGDPASDGSICSLSFDIDGNGKPYVAYSDPTESRRVTVKDYDYPKGKNPHRYDEALEEALSKIDPPKDFTRYSSQYDEAGLGSIVKTHRKEFYLRELKGEPGYFKMKYTWIVEYNGRYESLLFANYFGMRTAANVRYFDPVEMCDDVPRITYKGQTYSTKWLKLEKGFKWYTTQGDTVVSVTNTFLEGDNVWRYMMNHVTRNTDFLMKQVNENEYIVVDLFQTVSAVTPRRSVTITDEDFDIDNPSSKYRYKKVQ